MSPNPLATLLARCRAVCAGQASESDAELLRRFVRRQDAAAFEQLFERYAPLVWGVCRRILPAEADCEDALQATFLALVRQAGSLDGSRALGGWLHTVAVRVARKAQARSRRQSPCPLPPERPGRGDIADDVGSRELLRLVDAEVEHLPAALRLPLVLCCLPPEGAAAGGCLGGRPAGTGPLRRPAAAWCGPALWHASLPPRQPGNPCVYAQRQGTDCRRYAAGGVRRGYRPGATPAWPEFAGS